MIKHHEVRQTIRLHVDKGLVMLRNGTHPPIACALIDLSEGGCHCRAVPGTIDPVTFAEWKQLMAAGVPLEVEVSRPPHFIRLKLDGTVSHVDRLDDQSMELGIAFKEVGQAAGKALEHALFSIATDKIRKHNHPETVAAAVAPSAAEPPKLVEPHAHKDIKDVLIQTNLVEPAALSLAVERAEAAHLPLIRYLLKEHIVKPGDLCRAISLSASLPITDLREVQVSAELLHLFTFLTMLRYEFIPFAESRELLCIAAVAPLSVEVMNELNKLCQREILVFLAPADQIRKQLFKLRPRSAYKERDAMRVQATTQVDFELANKSGVNLNEEHYHASTIDISEMGLLLEVPIIPNFTPEQLLEKEHYMRLAVHFGKQIIHAFCSIKHVEPVSARESRRALWHMGVMVETIDPPDAALLHQACTMAATARMASRQRGYDLGPA